MKKLLPLLFLIAGCRTGFLPDRRDGGAIDLASSDLSSSDFAITPPVDGLFKPDLSANDLARPLDLARGPDLSTTLTSCPESLGTNLQAIRKGVVGSWVGSSTTPGWMAPYKVDFTFEANGHYSAHGSGGTPALYYGVDDDTPLKTYLLDNVLANGDGTGEIEVWFGGIPTTNRGGLEHVRVCRDGGVDRMSFDFFADWLGHIGPIHYFLTRTSP